MNNVLEITNNIQNLTIELRDDNNNLCNLNNADYILIFKIY